MADFDINDAEEMEFDTVTLTLEDDTELECAILAVYPAGARSYIALIPISEEGEADEDGDILIYRYIDNGEGFEPELENIEDDDEYEMAADAFDELLDEEDFEDGDDE